ncbi:hypothetical protein CPB84DRAFT_1851451 [Gymnopilus junonius]|uniref:Uncharacterized protein n=1 Tax=Gymnopilus junonius TaxID=109634 RepID=A0A9P5THK4_GYMJU|nr:hypothetical protein CPB84DRAFT_1851451 [Gymnopilus junonius]
MAEDLGLLFVFGEPAPDATEDEFNDWYDNEHAPLRLTVEGFHNALRYKATDSQTPSWLTLYDLASASVAKSEPYKALAAKASAREKALVPRLATLDRRIYELISTRSRPDLPATALPGKYILVVCMLVSPAVDEDFNKWYEEEHIDAIAKTLSWQRCRRYKLVDRVELTGKIDPAKKIHNYLAVHEFDSNDYNTTPEFIAAVSTPWSKKIRESVDDRYLRNFGLYKTIQKS